MAWGTVYISDLYLKPYVVPYSFSDGGNFKLLVLIFEVANRLVLSYIKDWMKSNESSNLHSSWTDCMAQHKACRRWVQPPFSIRGILLQNHLVGDKAFVVDSSIEQISGGGEANPGCKCYQIFRKNKNCSLKKTCFLIY